ncbi:MAG TPA: hypothetical protein VNH11_15230 [Pirellulales bacterium]|nr:hypothetical protein [Pirellulales bacterium]
MAKLTSLTDQTLNKPSVAAGTDPFWLPESCKATLVARLDRLTSRGRRRALAIVGGAGTGKTCVLRWLERVEMPRRRILSYRFSDPDVSFRQLADALLARIGRKRFATLLYELAAIYRPSLLGAGMKAYLARFAVTPSSSMEGLQQGLIEAGITKHVETANRRGRIFAETAGPSRFDFRRFITADSGVMAPSREQDRLFEAILRLLRVAEGVERAALLFDEFFQVSLYRGLTRKDAHDYRATLRRLLATTASGDLCVVFAMTPDAVERTRDIYPAFWNRCYRFDLSAPEKSPNRH